MKSILLTTLILIGVSTNICAQQKKPVQTKQPTTTQTIKDSLNNIVQKAEEGDADAQNTIGIWYYKGVHFQKDYAKAAKWWRAAATQKQKEALGNMGLLYQFGHGVERDSLKAVQCYVKSIAAGNIPMLNQHENKSHENALSAIVAAICYQNADGVKRDEKKALTFYELAAQKNSVDAYREMGFLYKKMRQEQKAYDSFSKAARMGDNSAAFQVARMTIRQTSPTDEQQRLAVSYLTKCSKSMAEAQYELGLLYYKGQFVVQDYQQAVSLFRTSAAKGYPLSQWNLALCLVNAKGCKENFEEALFWFGEASTKGFENSFKKRCEGKEMKWEQAAFPVYLQGMKHYFSPERDIETAYTEFSRVKKQSTDAEIMAAVCLANKNIKKSNPKKAFKQLLALANEDNASAAFYIASLYESGNGTDKNEEKALEFFKKAADGDYAPALCYLGNMFFEGKKVPKSESDAVRYYQRAEMLGHLSEKAAQNYITCLKKGLGGLTPDESKAKALEKKDYKDHVKALLQKI